MPNVSIQMQLRIDFCNILKILINSNFVFIAFISTWFLIAIFYLTGLYSYRWLCFGWSFAHASFAVWSFIPTSGFAILSRKESLIRKTNWQLCSFCNIWLRIMDCLDCSLLPFWELHSGINNLNVKLQLNLPYSVVNIWAIIQLF